MALFVETLLVLRGSTEVRDDRIVDIRAAVSDDNVEVGMKFDLDEGSFVDDSAGVVVCLIVSLINERKEIMKSYIFHNIKLCNSHCFR